MAISLKHTTVATGTNANNGEIAKEEWNEEHALTLATARLLGRSTAGTGAAEEIAAGAGLALSSGSLVLNGPAFNAYNTAYTLEATGGVETTCAFNTEEFDTNSNYNNSTYTFTPTVAGYYFFSAWVDIQPAAASLKSGIATIYNNSDAIIGTSGIGAATSDSIDVLYTQILAAPVGLSYANGTTDSFTLKVYGTTTSGNVLYAGAFFGCLLRG